MRKYGLGDLSVCGDGYMKWSSKGNGGGFLVIGSNGGGGCLCRR